MKKVYQIDNSKKKDLTKILENDPYAENSFARVGYKLKDGAAVDEDKSKTYLYISTDADFIKNSEQKLSQLIEKIDQTVEKRIIKKIEDEEEAAESGFGSIFGD